MRAKRVGLVWTVVLLISCARTPAPPAPAPARPAAEAKACTAPACIGVATVVPVPRAFRDAVANGTRTTVGRPGPRYFQQHVDYRIEAELDPRTARLTGQEEIAYVNQSPDTLTEVVLRLYQNLFRPGAPRTDPTPTTGGMVLERVTVDGREAHSTKGAPATRPFYQVDNTIMGVALPRALLPGDTAHLEIAWHFTVPPAGAPRMGHEGRELYLVAQWYPQIAVYDDVRGWDTHPYLGTGEFYLEYGDFDVSLTLPEGYLVGATGTLLNPDEVLTGTERARLALAMTVDTVVHVLRADEQRPGVITQQVPGRELTWHYRARSVRDFAFATSNRYVWDATHAESPDPNGGARPHMVQINALYRPDAHAWREAAVYTRHAIAFHAAHWLPYMYPQMTSAEGPEEGMEYPMLVFVAGFAEPREVMSVITHEVGHQWFPMMVGSDEHDFAWQDEGLNTYIEDLATLDFYPGTDVWAEDFEAYLGIAGSPAEVPMMRGADLYGNERAYDIASYMKPALVVRGLWTVIGRDKLDEGLREYAATWRLKHPQALDFFHMIDAAAGQDLGWYWFPWFYTTDVLDQGVAGVAQTGDQVRITIENRGQIPMPVTLRLTLADGRSQDVKLPASVWFTGARRYTETVTVAGPIQRVVIDPDRLLPDADRGNNVWSR